MVVEQPSAFGKVAVVMGGTSAEREISLKSGTAVLTALQRQGVDAHGLDTRDGVIEPLQHGGFDRVFIMLHGRGGEDGVIQGVLETLGLPYTGSGVLASALGMDKQRTKQLWLGVELPTPPFCMIGDVQECGVVIDEIGLPVFVKPAHEGSSVGMSKVTEAEQLPEAWRKARQFDECVLAERWIDGGEYTVAILAGEALPPIRVQPAREFYDYEAKYLAGTTQYHCPCGLADSAIEELQSLALQAFAAVGCRGWGRVDVMRDRDGNFWLIEVNTVPGMTERSLVPMAAKAAGIGFDALVWRILAQTLAQGGEHGA
ncbi:MAG: D-alanine--D-alanine ligase [Gammaproteobacteria bacterium RBG_16_57_12]|nr:MAG: D-alanine--D-alanine ligase [Gammaproteobacteria bacterium RBG_16_57_12]